MQSWSIDSWRNYKACQQPEYLNQEKLTDVESQLQKKPPLIFAGEVRSLESELADVANGKSFLLQGGDCAESFFDFNTTTIRDTFKVLMQMAVILTFAGSKSVVKIGRLAGQFAKPRSSDTETINGVTLPSYRGDIINGFEFSNNARLPDPERMLTAYNQSAATLNIVRAFAQGGLASLDKIHAWNLDFVKGPATQKFSKLVDQIDLAMGFMNACGINIKNTLGLKETTLYTSHEALLLPYEQSLTRKDHLTDLVYDCSGHMLWLGDRTRQPNGAHVEFLRGVNNPLGIKIGPTIKKDELLLLLDKLNINNKPGRITLITRLGDKIDEKLPELIRCIQNEGRNVIWSCDPMHGNTITTRSGYKTRRVTDIFKEIKGFFAIHKSEGTYGGGIHFEMTGADVTECVGGEQNNITEECLSKFYKTQCDPRLNASQAIEIAFMVAEIIKSSP